MGDKPFRIMEDDNEHASIIFLCDRPIHAPDDEYHLPADEDKILSCFPAYIEVDGVFREVPVQDLRKKKEIGWLCSDQSIIEILETRKILASVFVNSPGGDSDAGDTFARALKNGGRKRGWETQAIIAKESASMAAIIATACQRIYAPDSATLMFHYYSSGARTEYDSVEYTPEDSLIRLQQLAKDKVVFQASEVSRRFRNVLDRKDVNADDYIEFSGRELKAASVIEQTEARVVQEGIEKFLTKKIPRGLRRRIVPFLNLYKKMQ